MIKTIATGIHRIDSETHFIVTTNRGFKIHQINGGGLVRSCEDIEGGLSLC